MEIARFDEGGQLGARLGGIGGREGVKFDGEGRGELNLADA